MKKKNLHLILFHAQLNQARVGFILFINVKT